MWEPARVRRRATHPILLVFIGLTVGKKPRCERRESKLLFIESGRFVTCFYYSPFQGGVPVLWPKCTGPCFQSRTPLDACLVESRDELVSCVKAKS